MNELSLEEVTNFFENDEKIKQMLIYSVPDESDFYNEDTTIKYQDRLFELLKEMKIRFKEMASIYKSEELNQNIDERFINLEKQLAECGSNQTKLTEFYKKQITEMNPKLIEKMDEECYGYNAEEIYPDRFSEDCNSLNDLLHILHTCAVNDNEFYKRVPLIRERKDEQNKKNNIRMYGEEFELSKEIFDSFPETINNDPVIIDILSLKQQKQIYMMIRDLGHSLTININDRNPEKTMVKYFIPKICDVNKVNQLEGVKKVADTAEIGDYTIGQYETKKEGFCEHFFDFLSKVPTDNDIDIEKVMKRADEIYRQEQEKNKEQAQDNNEKEIVGENKEDNKTIEKNETNTNLPMVMKNTFPQKIKNKLKSVFNYISSLRKKESKDKQDNNIQIQNPAQIAHDRLVADLAKSARRNSELDQQNVTNRENKIQNKKIETKDNDIER